MTISEDTFSVRSHEFEHLGELNGKMRVPTTSMDMPVRTVHDSIDHSHTYDMVLGMIVKNEGERSLRSTFESVLGKVDAFYIMDTGSEDDTINYVWNWCNKHGIPVMIEQTTFVDFGVTRNQMLRELEEHVKCSFVLLLDAMDEVKCEPGFFKRFVETYKDTWMSCVSLQQRWRTDGQNTTTYHNNRIIRPRSGFAYVGAIHEHLYQLVNHRMPILQLEQDKIELYQDRTKNDDKTFKRFTRDEKILLKCVERNPKDSRSLFYLGQTYGCLGDHENELKYYLKRIECINGFEEERYQAYVRCGLNYIDYYKDWEKALNMFMLAIDHSPDRIEGYAYITKRFCMQKQWSLAYLFASHAVKIKKNDVKYVLFHNSVIYEYWIHHYFSVICFNLKRDMNNGQKACETAIKFAKDHNYAHDEPGSSYAIDLQLQKEWNELLGKYHEPEIQQPATQNNLNIDAIVNNAIVNDYIFNSRTPLKQTPVT